MIHCEEKYSTALHTQSSMEVNLCSVSHVGSPLSIASTLPDFNKKIEEDKTNPYYQKGDIQTFDYVLAVCKDLPGDEAVCVDDIIKCVTMYKSKNGIEDIKEMLWYGNKLLEILESKK